MLACITSCGSTTHHPGGDCRKGAISMANRPSRNEFVGLGFTERLTRHPRIGYYIYPDALCGLNERLFSQCVVFVVDQLLVVSRLAEHMVFNGGALDVRQPDGRARLRSREERCRRRGQRSDLAARGRHASGKHKHADVAEAVWDLRKQLPSGHIGAGDARTKPRSGPGREWRTNAPGGHPKSPAPSLSRLGCRRRWRSS